MAMKKCPACGTFNPATRSGCFKCKAEFASSPGGAATASTPAGAASGNAAPASARFGQKPAPARAAAKAPPRVTARHHDDENNDPVAFRNVDNPDGFPEFNNPDEADASADDTDLKPRELHLAGKIVDGHKSNFPSPDAMIEMVIRPSGPYCVSECNSSVQEHLRIDPKKFLIYLVAVLIVSSLGGGLVDLVISVYLIWLFGAAAMAWIRGLRIIPDAVVLHGRTLSVFNGVLRNKTDGVTSYNEAYHFPVKSISRVFILSWFQFSFKTPAPPTSVTLTRVKYFLPWTKSRFYTKKIIPLKEMKAKVL